MSSGIPLDPAIRDWVLLPIVFFVILVTYARLYGMRLLSPPPEGALPIDEAGVQQRGLIAFSQRLRFYGGYISQRGWAMRKASLIGAPEKGLLDATVKDANPMANMAGPASMDMMKMQVRHAAAARARACAYFLAHNTAAHPILPLRCCKWAASLASA